MVQRGVVVTPSRSRFATHAFCNLVCIGVLVVWLNLPLGQVWQVSAEKAGVTYPTVRFSIDQADIDAGVQLFIASPPDSLEGDNDSPPGED